jgi:hypothetical protein
MKMNMENPSEEVGVGEVRSNELSAILPEKGSKLRMPMVVAASLFSLMTAAGCSSDPHAPRLNFEFLKPTADFVGSALVEANREAAANNTSYVTDSSSMSYSLSAGAGAGGGSTGAGFSSSSSVNNYHASGLGDVYTAKHGK